MQQNPAKDMTTALITQSNYIPWRGYFDLIAAAHVFIVLDDVQFTRRDWRNRNRIKTASGTQWLSVPVASKGQFLQRICDTAVSEEGWAEAHWKTLAHAYGKAPCFDEVAQWLAPVYRGLGEVKLLSDINRALLEAVCGYMDITTPIRRSTDYFALQALDGFDRNSRLLELCKAAGATRYISGPAAKEYMDLEPYAQAGIEVHFADYAHYPVYPQLHGAFDPAVSIVDTLFSLGKKAREVTVGFAV